MKDHSKIAIPRNQEYFFVLFILSELSVGIDISGNLSLVGYHLSCLNKSLPIM